MPRLYRPQRPYSLCGHTSYYHIFWRYEFGRQNAHVARNHPCGSTALTISKPNNAASRFLLEKIRQWFDWWKWWIVFAARSLIYNFGRILRNIHIICDWSQSRIACGILGWLRWIALPEIMIHVIKMRCPWKYFILLVWLPLLTYLDTSMY